jgi:hypothetical protein
MWQHYLNGYGVWGPWDVEREGDEPLHEGEEILQYPGSDRFLWRQAQHLLHYHTECKLFSSKENTARKWIPRGKVREEMTLVSQSHLSERFMQRIVTRWRCMSACVIFSNVRGCTSISPCSSTDFLQKIGTFIIITLNANCSQLSSGTVVDDEQGALV